MEHEMIVVGNQKPDHRVVHVIVGVETELYMDLHGAAEIDVTELMSGLPPGTQVKLRLTRCKSEAGTVRGLVTGDVPHMYSFVGAPATQEPAGPVKGRAPDLEEIMAKDRGTRPVPKKNGCCSYCGSITEILDIPGISICRTCAQIEIGRAQAKE